MSFIDKGIVRYYAIHGDKEITFDFAFQNSFYCAYDSFYSRKKTAVYIQAITPCILYSISHENLNALYAICETSKKLGQIATEYLCWRPYTFSGRWEKVTKGKTMTSKDKSSSR